MITWGAVGNSHDASLAVFNDDKLIWAGLAKDFSGIPNDPHLNEDIIQYAYKNYWYPEQIVWYERPLLKTMRQWQAGQGWLLKENNIQKYFKERRVSAPIRYTQHHHSHAAYAYYTQTHDDCAVICLDSIGEFETLTIWHGKNGELKKIYRQGYPHSLGLFYSAMTQRVGLVPQRDEYQIAQMAEYGDPEVLAPAMFNDLVGRKTKRIFNTVENLHRGCLWWKPELTTEQDMCNIAAATQFIFENHVSLASNWALEKTGSSNLALAGGGAYNKQAIEKISHKWNNIHVPVHPGDPGSCVGCVLAKTKQFITVDSAWHKAV